MFNVIFLKELAEILTTYKTPISKIAYTLSVFIVFILDSTYSLILKHTLLSTPGPWLMRIHLMQNSTSANFGKTPKIFT